MGCTGVRMSSDKQSDIPEPIMEMAKEYGVEWQGRSVSEVHDAALEAMKRETDKRVRQVVALAERYEIDWAGMEFDKLKWKLLQTLIDKHEGNILERKPPHRPRKWTPDKQRLLLERVDALRDAQTGIGLATACKKLAATEYRGLSPATIKDHYKSFKKERWRHEQMSILATLLAPFDED